MCWSCATLPSPTSPSRTGVTATSPRPSAAHAPDILGQVAQEELRTEGGGAQLGVGQPQIVAALGEVVGELIGQGEAEANRGAVLVDQIDGRDFGLLSAVLGERGREEGL